VYQKVKEQRNILVSTLAYVIGMTVPMICELTGLTTTQVTYTRDRNPVEGVVPKTYEDRLMAAIRYIGKNRNSEVAKLLEGWEPIVTLQATVAGMIYLRLNELDAWKQSLRPGYRRLHRALTGDKYWSQVDSYKTVHKFAKSLWDSHLLKALNDEAIDSIDAFVARASQLVDHFGSTDDIVTHPNMVQYMEHALETALATLSERDQRVLRLHFGIGEERQHTFEEIGGVLDGISGGRCQQIEAKALRKLRHSTRMPIIETVGELKKQSVVLRRQQAVSTIEKEKPFFNTNLLLRIDTLELSVRSANCLTYHTNGIEYVWQLVQMSESELLRVKNFGRKSLKEIREILMDMGLTLGMKLDAETLAQCTTKK
jgi:hypothetical protein